VKLVEEETEEEDELEEEEAEEEMEDWVQGRRRWDEEEEI